MQPGAESLRRSPAGVASPLPLSCEDRVLAPSLSRKKMKLSRQFTVFGSAIFCVVIFSLYLMLDRGHLDYPRGPRREGSFPQVSTWCKARGRRASLGALTSSRRRSAPGQGEATPDDPAEPAPAQAVLRSDPPEFAKCWASFGGSLAPARSGLVRHSHPGLWKWPRAPAGGEPAPARVSLWVAPSASSGFKLPEVARMPLCTPEAQRT